MLIQSDPGPFLFRNLDNQSVISVKFAEKVKTSPSQKDKDNSLTKNEIVLFTAFFLIFDILSDFLPFSSRKKF